MTDADILRASATALVNAVRSGKASARQVVRAFLDRTERLEPLLNTYVTLTAEAAMEQAAAVDRRAAAGEDPGPLAGLPVSVKDLIAVGGVRQTFGSRLFAQNVAADDAPAVARLRAAGACIMGKTTTSELGSKAVGDSPLTGVTRNPWDLQKTPGGSSAGAAAGVAARLVPVALGTDGGGSIRIPSAFCGLVGIKATFGRVPVWPPSATPSLAHVGPIARTVEDAALVLAVISGFDPCDPGASNAAVPDYVAAVRSSIAGMRIAWVAELGLGHVDAFIAAACENAVASLAREGAMFAWRAEPLLEHDPAPAWNELFYGSIARRLALAGPWEEVNAQIDPALRSAILEEQSRMPRDDGSIQSQRLQTMAALDRAFENADVLAMPTVPVTAPPVGVDVPVGHPARNAVDWSYFTYPFNLTGHPALSVPVGMDGAGMPIGLQLVAPPGREADLIRVAAAVQRQSAFDCNPDLS